MRCPIQMPKYLTRYLVFVTITLVNINGCVVSAEETVSPSQIPSSEVLTDGEVQTLSTEEKFLEIQKVLGEIDKTPQGTPSKKRSTAHQLTVTTETESGATGKAMMTGGNKRTNQMKSGMGKGKMMMKGMPSEAQPPNKAMGMCKGMMCKKMRRSMSMMGQRPMSQVGSMQTTDSLPGYSYAPHLYHLGEVEFFLDHTQDLSLSSQQSAALSAIKNKWMARQEEITEQISTQEEALWQATAQGQPDIVEIRKKITEIEALSGQLRLTFITRVGEAVHILTPEQVGILTSEKELP